MTVRILNAKMIRLAEFNYKNKSLIIYCHNDDIYESFDVPFNVFEDLVNAPDKDNYYLKNVKTKYRTEKHENN